MPSYSKPSISGYNSNPPSDDGSETAANEVAWQTHIDKIGGPIKSYADAINDAVETTIGNLGTAADLTGTIATQANQEAASSTTAFVTSGRQQFHPSAPKFWVRFDGTDAGPTITADESYNVTSVTKNGTGDYTITIATDFAAATWVPFIYSTPAIAATNYEPRNRTITSMAAGSIRIETNDGGSPASNEDHAVICVMGFGDQ